MRRYAAHERSASSILRAIGLSSSVLALAVVAGCIPDLTILVSGWGGGGAVASSTSTASSTATGGGGGGAGGKGATASTASGMGGTGGTGATSAVASSTGTGGAGTGGKGGTGGEGGSGGEALPTLRFDFETDLGSWQPVGNQIPPDVQDNVVQSTTAFHHGTGALDMVFDGMYTPSSGASFYGVYTPMNPPPAGAHVTAWMMTTATSVSASFYIQASPDYSWSS